MKITKIFYYINILSIIYLCFFNIYAQEYPKYGTEQWYKLSLEEKKKSIQIPDNKLLEMKTEDLIKAYLDFLLIGLIYAYDAKDEGFKRVYEEFNGLRELLNRNDAGNKILNCYKNMEPGNYDESWESIKKGKFSVDFTYIEILLAQENVLKKLNKIEFKSLLLELLSKYEKKYKYYSLHSDLGIGSTIFTMTRAAKYLEDTEKLQSELSTIPNIEALLKGYRINPDIYIQIINITKRYINKF